MRDARELADYILLKAAKEGRFLTPLHVNKMCYMVHGFMLRNTGKGAFHNDVEAWSYGPVIREVYDAFRAYGGGPVRRLWGTGERVCVGNARNAGTMSTLKDALGDRVAGIADKVVRGYAGMNGGSLIAMTHEKGTPWSDTRKLFRTPVIPTRTILDYYEKMGPDTVGK